MTPLDLQRALAAEFAQIFAGQLFPREGQDGDADTMVPMDIYLQALPYHDGYSFSNYAPYLTIQIHNGKQEEETEPAEVVIVLTFGFYRPDDDNQGHVFVLNAIENARQDLFGKRTIDGKYFIKLPWEWQLNDEDVWPYFIGSVETHWNMPIMQPDDENI